MTATRLNPQPASGARTLAQLGISVTNKSTYSLSLSNVFVYGKVMIAQVNISSSNAISAGVLFNPASISGLNASYAAIVGPVAAGHATTAGNVWVKFNEATAANVARDATFIAFLP